MDSRLRRNDEIPTMALHRSFQRFRRMLPDVKTLFDELTTDGEFKGKFRPMRYAKHMNMHSKLSEAAIGSRLPDSNDFHIARSKFLDAFSELEIAVCSLLATNSNFKLTDNKPFGARVDDIKNITPNNNISKDKISKITEKLVKIYLLLSIRSDIVHSQLHVVNIDGEIHAKICNNNTVKFDPTKVRLLNMECFKALTSESKKIANELNQIINQPNLSPKAGIAANIIKTPNQTSKQNTPSP